MTPERGAPHFDTPEGVSAFDSLAHNGSLPHDYNPPAAGQKANQMAQAGPAVSRPAKSPQVNQPAQDNPTIEQWKAWLAEKPAGISLGAERVAELRALCFARHGCHADMASGDVPMPTCAIDDDRVHDCVHAPQAQEAGGKETCEHWRAYHPAVDGGRFIEVLDALEAVTKERDLLKEGLLDVACERTILLCDFHGRGDIIRHLRAATQDCAASLDEAEAELERALADEDRLDREVCQFVDLLGSLFPAVDADDRKALAVASFTEIARLRKAIAELRAELDALTAAGEDLHVVYMAGAEFAAGPLRGERDEWRRRAEAAEAENKALRKKMEADEQADRQADAEDAAEVQAYWDALLTLDAHPGADEQVTAWAVASLPAPVAEAMLGTDEGIRALRRMMVQDDPVAEAVDQTQGSIRRGARRSVGRFSLSPLGDIPITPAPKPDYWNTGCDHVYCIASCPWPGGPCGRLTQHLDALAAKAANSTVARDRAISEAVMRIFDGERPGRLG